MITLGEAIALLDGKDSDGVASLLVKDECKGRRRNSCFCPVAVFLRKKTGSLWRVSGFGVEIETTMHSTSSFGATTTSAFKHPLPSGVRNFIVRFDIGMHEELSLPAQGCM